MRWISGYSKGWHNLMVCPFSQKELPASQSLEPAPCTRLNHSRSDLAYTQQPSIILVVAYLTLGDAIKCSIDGS